MHGVQWLWKGYSEHKATVETGRRSKLTVKGLRTPVPADFETRPAVVDIAGDVPVVSYLDLEKDVFK